MDDFVEDIVEDVCTADDEDVVEDIVESASFTTTGEAVGEVEEEEEVEEDPVLEEDPLGRAWREDSGEEAAVEDSSSSSITKGSVEVAVAVSGL